jgi:signal transduction histidine kinase
LSATYGVIQDHGGQIVCYNKPEGGAIFVIKLPAVTSAAARAEVARA